MMTAFVLQKALEQDFKDKASNEALAHIRAAYFEDFTDATEMDNEFMTAFDAVFNLLFPSGEDTFGNGVEVFYTPPTN
jgi:hypothetical protein